VTTPPEKQNNEAEDFRGEPNPMLPNFPLKSPLFWLNRSALKTGAGAWV